MRIGSRLILNTVLIAFFSVIITSMVVGWSAYYLGKQAIEEESKKHLISLRESKKDEIERYFNTIRNQIITFANDLMIIDAMNDFNSAYQRYKLESAAGQKGKFDVKKIQTFLADFTAEYKKKNGQDQSVDTKSLLNFSNTSSFLLQYNYIIENPNPLGEKDLLNTVNDGTKYSEAHKKYHPIIREYLEKFGYYDVFLIDPVTSEVVYTVFKEVDFASSLKNGVSHNTGLEKVFNAAVFTKNPGETFIADFEPYLASYNEQAAFIATSIYKDNNLIGVLVFQFPIEIINKIMTYDKHWEDVGLGQTGETYLVGSDYRLRSMSRFFLESPTEYLDLMKFIGLSDSLIGMMKDKQTTIGLQPVITEGTELVFKDKKPGVGIFPDYRSIPVLSAYTPLNIPELNWALMGEMDLSEAFAPVLTLAKDIILMTIFVALIGIFISIIIGVKLNSTISVPIVNLNKAIKNVTLTMDLTKRLPVNSADEIGEMAAALNQLLITFREALEETISSTEQIEVAGNELRALSELSDLTSKEQVQKIATAEKDIHELSLKLRKISGQFRILKAKSQEEEDW